MSLNLKKGLLKLVEEIDIYEVIRNSGDAYLVCLWLSAYYINYWVHLISVVYFCSTSENKPCILENIFIELIKFAAMSIEFSFNNVIYRQIDGISMACPLGYAIVFSYGFMSNMMWMILLVCLIVSWRFFHKTLIDWFQLLWKKERWFFYLLLECVSTKTRF